MRQRRNRPPRRVISHAVSPEGATTTGEKGFVLLFRRCKCCDEQLGSEHPTGKACHKCQWCDEGQDDSEADHVWGGNNQDYSLSEARVNYRFYGISFRPSDPRFPEENRRYVGKNRDYEKIGFVCPCCKYPTLSEVGGYEICDICSWEDDGQDDPHADEGSGPNGISLTEARENFQTLLARLRSVQSSQSDESDGALMQLVDFYDRVRSAEITGEGVSFWRDEGELLKAKLHELRFPR